MILKMLLQNIVLITEFLSTADISHLGQMSHYLTAPDLSLIRKTNVQPLT